MIDLDDFPFDELLTRGRDKGLNTHKDLVIQVLNYVEEERNKKGLKPNKEEAKLVEQIIKIYVNLGYIKGKINANIWGGEDSHVYALNIDTGKDTAERLLFAIDVDGWKII